MIRLACLITNHHYRHPATAVTASLFLECSTPDRRQNTWPRWYKESRHYSTPRKAGQSRPLVLRKNNLFLPPKNRYVISNQGLRLVSLRDIFLFSPRRNQ